MPHTQKLSPRQSGEELGLPRSTVYSLIARGLLPAKRVSPRRLVIERADLEAYLAAANVTPKEAVPA